MRKGRNDLLSVRVTRSVKDIRAGRNAPGLI